MHVLYLLNSIAWILMTQFQLYIIFDIVFLSQMKPLLAVIGPVGAGKVIICKYNYYTRELTRRFLTRDIHMKRETTFI